VNFPDNFYVKALAEIIKPLHDKTEREYVEPMNMYYSEVFHPVKQYFNNVYDG
jgi:hypothetical protein